jgi:hypothetical protein
METITDREAEVIEAHTALVLIVRAITEDFGDADTVTIPAHRLAAFHAAEARYRELEQRLWEDFRRIAI